MTDGLMNIPTCLDCGVCCFSELPTYVRVTGDDHARLGELADRLTRFVGNRCYMRMVDGHCAALVLDRERRRFVCSVYELRPVTCRDLERGGPACLGELALKADRPAAALRAVT
jgi:Fe-S-cluster containining protein